MTECICKTATTGEYIPVVKQGLSWQCLECKEPVKEHKKPKVDKETQRDLDIALYKLSEALMFGDFRPDHRQNIQEKYEELKKRNDTRGE